VYIDIRVNYLAQFGSGRGTADGGGGNAVVVALGRGGDGDEVMLCESGALAFLGPKSRLDNRNNNGYV